MRKNFGYIIDYKFIVLLQLPHSSETNGKPLGDFANSAKIGFSEYIADEKDIEDEIYTHLVEKPNWEEHLVFLSTLTTTYLGSDSIQFGIGM